jgi:thymidylate synthase
MNMFGFVKFNEDVIAAEVAKRSGREVRLARMNWHADSYHIYGKDLKQAEARLFSKLESSDFEDRVFRMDDEIISEIYAEAEQAVKDKIKKYDEEH